MAIPEHPELTWSRSHSKMLRTCKRQWFYDKMLNWQGWLDSAPERRQGAYMLKQVTTFPAFCGTIIHDLIDDSLIEIKEDRADLDGLVREAMRRFEIAWDQSIEGRWKRAPKKCVNFYEHLYGFEPDKHEAFTTTESLAKRCLSALLDEFDFANKLRTRWSEVHTFTFGNYAAIPVFYVAGAKVHALPDFVGVRHDGVVELLDWKTGREHSVDRNQIAFYYLTARERALDRRVVINEGTKLEGRLVYLAEGAREVAVAEESQDLELIREGIAEDTALIRGLTNELALGDRTCLEVKDAEEERFALAEDNGPCLRCSYLYLCRQEKGLGDKAATRQWLHAQRSHEAGEIVYDADDEE